MFILLSVILTLAAILLILVVLLQPGKGGGLAGGGSSFGSGMTGQFNTMFGARRTADFLQKFTIYLALGILGLTILTNKFFLPNTGAEVERRPVTAGAPASSTTVPQAPAPAPAPQQAAPQQSAPAQSQPAPAQGQPAEQQGQ